MSSSNMQLTHEEIWDDSALIDSWNEALDEYKKYHSIHARGLRLEDLEAEELAAEKISKKTVSDPKTDGPNAGERSEVLGNVLEAPSEDASAVPANANDAVPMAPPIALLGNGLYEGQQQQQQQQSQ